MAAAERSAIRSSKGAADSAATGSLRFEGFLTHDIHDDVSVRVPDVNGKGKKQSEGIGEQCRDSINISCQLECK